jgi:hypothetical protein
MIPLSLIILFTAWAMSVVTIYHVGWNRGYDIGAGKQQESLWKR